MFICFLFRAHVNLYRKNARQKLSVFEISEAASYYCRCMDSGIRYCMFALNYKYLVYSDIGSFWYKVYKSRFQHLFGYFLMTFHKVFGIQLPLLPLGRLYPLYFSGICQYPSQCNALCVYELIVMREF